MSSLFCKHVFKVFYNNKPTGVKQLLYTLGTQTSIVTTLKSYHSPPYDNQLSDKNDISNLPNKTYYTHQFNNKEEFTSEYENELERGIGRTYEEQNERFLLKPDQPDDAKILRFAIIGIPNAGKSTLINQLVNWKVSSVSAKVHTTRENTLGVLTDNNNQIVFIDTPGLVTLRSGSKHNIDHNMISDPENSLRSVDMIGIIVDASSKWHSRELDQSILQLLYTNLHLPAVLILNKIDKVNKKNNLLETTRILTEGIVGKKKADFIRKKVKTDRKSYREIFKKHNLKMMNQADLTHDSPDNTWDCDSNKESPVDAGDEAITWQDYHKRMQFIRSKLKNKKGWPNFDNVFMISALNNDGISELKNYLLASTMPGDWEFHSSFITNQHPLLLAKNLIWEKLLDVLPQEVPYNVKIDAEMWELDDKETLNTLFTIHCFKKKHLHMIVGNKGKKIQTLVSEAQQSLMDAFRINVMLKINVNLAVKDT
ncbi:GTPase Era, mitochondrial-like [Argonauta hians]